jgi:hypothetical protein
MIDPAESRVYEIQRRLPYLWHQVAGLAGKSRVMGGLGMKRWLYLSMLMGLMVVLVGGLQVRLALAAPRGTAEAGALDP